MTCDEFQKLVDGYLDGELDLVSTLAFEQHLAGCARCARIYQNRKVLKATFKVNSLYYELPVGLEKQVKRSLQKANLTPVKTWSSPHSWVILAVALLAILLISWSLLQILVHPATSNEDVVAQEIVTGHVRSLLVNHLADVASSDQHTVKPWFNGKLDFSPPVEDLKEQGFPLMGGRLDYLDKRVVAALIYQRRGHVINLFIWANLAGSESSANKLTRQGYNLIYWSKAGMTYWAVSDLNQSELEDFAKLLQTQNQ